MVRRARAGGGRNFNRREKGRDGASSRSNWTCSRTWTPPTTRRGTSTPPSRWRCDRPRCGEQAAVARRAERSRGSGKGYHRADKLRAVLTEKIEEAVHERVASFTFEQVEARFGRSSRRAGRRRTTTARRRARRSRSSTRSEILNARTDSYQRETPSEKMAARPSRRRWTRFFKDEIEKRASPSRPDRRRAPSQVAGVARDIARAARVTDRYSNQGGRNGEAEAGRAAFEGYAVLELMGHRRLGGYVRETTLAGAAVFASTSRRRMPTAGRPPTRRQSRRPPRRSSMGAPAHSRSRPAGPPWRAPWPPRGSRRADYYEHRNFRGRSRPATRRRSPTPSSRTAPSDELP